MSDSPTACELMCSFPRRPFSNRFSAKHLGCTVKKTREEQYFAKLRRAYHGARDRSVVPYYDSSGVDDKFDNARKPHDPSDERKYLHCLVSQISLLSANSIKPSPLLL